MKQKKPQKPKSPGWPTPEQEEQKAKKSELENLRDTIEDLQKEKDEIFGKLQRVSADYINFQKRTHKQVADTIAYEKEKIVKTLLPALDNFEHTLQNAASAKSTDVLIKGIRIIYDQILDILKSHGVERIDSLGAKFDPALHEVITQRAEPEKEENAVLEEFQKGYKLNGRVIRPTRVIINKKAVPQQEQAEQKQPDVKDDKTDTSDERRETSDE